MSNVARAFSRAASAYAYGASVQRRIAETLVSLVPQKEDVSSALDAGCGTGFLTRYLQHRFPDAEITAIDIASLMLARARKYLGSESSVTFVEADARKFSSEVQFDLIASSSALHWMDPWDRTLEHLTELAAPGGLLAIAVMTDGTLREIHAARKEVSPQSAEPVIFPKRGDLLSAAERLGWKVLSAERSEFAEEHETVDEMLTSLHALGLTATTAESVPRLSVGEYRQLVRLLSRRFEETEEKPRLTYDVQFLIACRPR